MEQWLNAALNRLSCFFDAKPVRISKCVFFCDHKEYGKVALKWACSKERKSLLCRESLWYKNSNVENTPVYLDFIESPPFYFLLTSWIDGKPLSLIMSQQQRVNLNWIDDISDILNQCHKRGINHGDIKPSNIIIQSKQAYLIDFGSYCYHGDHYQNLTRYSYTPMYAAFNPLTHSGMVRACDDWYSLVATIMAVNYQHYSDGMTLIDAIKDENKLKKINLPVRFLRIIKQQLSLNQ